MTQVVDFISLYWSAFIDPIYHRLNIKKKNIETGMSQS